MLSIIHVTRSESYIAYQVKRSTEVFVGEYVVEDGTTERKAVNKDYTWLSWIAGCFSIDLRPVCRNNYLGVHCVRSVSVVVGACEVFILYQVR